MLEVKTTVTFKIPSDGSCHLNSRMLCRFCTPGDLHFKCALYGEPLQAMHGTVLQCNSCLDAVNAIHTKVEDPIVDVDPVKIIRHTVKEFCRIYTNLRRRKVSEVMALELAKEHVINPDNTL